MFQKALAKRREENQGGFTLIELLVVMIIIGILAAIAIPVFINQKDKAADSAVQSDLRNAAMVVETAFSDTTPNAYPADDAAFDALADLKLTKSIKDAVDANGAAYALAADGKSYTITLVSNSGDTYKYDSLAGGVAKV